MYFISESLNLLSEYCRYVLFGQRWRILSDDPSEFLIHAADVEGLCQGIDEDLVKSEFQHNPCCFKALNINILILLELGEWTRIPTTYAGGARGTYQPFYFNLSAESNRQIFLISISFRDFPTGMWT